MSEQQAQGADAVVDLNNELKTRREKLAALREQGVPFPNDFRRDHTSDQLHADFDGKENEELEALNIEVAVAGRMMTRRIMGKASFVTLQDVGGRIQLYVSRDDLPEGIYNEQFKKWDLGDILGAKGKLFKTKTGELSIHCTELRLLTKALRPLPDKFHGLQDQEARYRQRYLDLISNDESRKTFKIRSQIMAGIRQFMVNRDFMEVETPMMQVIPGGASARPFITHHNALDLDMYLRIAPELYLKRLVVGGFDRVFEINRDFRNEGVDATHAPEFTMVEAYQAYGNYDTIGALVKQLVQDTAMDVFGTHKVTLLDGSEYDFGGEWKTISMYDSLSEALGEEIVPNGGPDNPGTSVEHLGAIADKLGVERDDVENHGKLVEHLWEHFYEDKLFEPTFVRDFPVETSPLVKGHRSKPGVVEKWDLYVRGFELATGYSELNDPVVQRERFVAQAKDALAGDEEACDIDEDFLEALGVGMPPAGGMGMGIDRLLIALTGATIRETITFPLVKPLN